MVLTKIAFDFSTTAGVPGVIGGALRDRQGKTERSILAVLPGQETISEKNHDKIILMFKLYCSVGA